MPGELAHLPLVAVVPVSMEEEAMKIGTPEQPHSWRDIHKKYGIGKPIQDYRVTNRDQARQLVAQLERADTSDLRRAVLANRGEVRYELDLIRLAKEDDPQHIALSALVFAILSPQLRFQENVTIARQVVQEFYDAWPTTNYDFWSALDVNGMPVGLKPTRHERLVKNERIFWAHDITKEMTFPRINAMHGMGPKTTAMALALWDEWSPVFTIDLWIARLMFDLIGMTGSYGFQANSRPYAILQEWWLGFAKEMQPYGMSTFEFQWSLWNLARGFHQTHLPIFGLEEQP